MTRWTRRLAVIGVTLAGSVLTFWILLRLTRPGWKSHEYFAIAFWTLPLCFLVLLFAKVESRWFAQRNALIQLVATIVLAVVCSVLWTFLAVALTGGYALAFDANPFVCWTIGSLAGMLTAVHWPRTQVKSDHTSAEATSLGANEDGAPSEVEIGRVRDGVIIRGRTTRPTLPHGAEPGAFLAAAARVLEVGVDSLDVGAPIVSRYGADELQVYECVQLAEDIWRVQLLPPRIPVQEFGAALKPFGTLAAIIAAAETAAQAHRR
jgi:hypothetical protein